ncbi:hypothetical protein [Streptomyces sp. NPDC050564]|uniref:hypothetical protein n=1 Tax=Streptomyces sp. NPDC050564 TaxID=3365631 RepID=UPI0037B10813
MGEALPSHIHPLRKALDVASAGPTYGQSRVYLTEALDLSRRRLDPGDEARALTALGAVDLSVGEGGRAITRVTAAMALSRRLFNGWVTSMALVVLGLAHQFEGRNEEALVCFAGAQTLPRRRADRVYSAGP